MEGIGSPLSALGSSIGNLGSIIVDGITDIGNHIVNDITDAIVVTKNGIINGVSGIADDISSLNLDVSSLFSSVLDNISGFKDTVIALKDSAMESISNQFSSLSATVSGLKNSVFEEIGYFKDMIYYQILDIVNEISGVKDTVTSLVSYVNPLDSNFFIRQLLYVDAEDAQAIQDDFDSMINMLKNKLLIIETIEAFTSALENVDISKNDVSFTIHLPEKYGGNSVEFIDFTPFLSYADNIKMLIRVFIWAAFLIRTYRRLPKIIY